LLQLSIWASEKKKLPQTKWRLSRCTFALLTAFLTQACTTTTDNQEIPLKSNPAFVKRPPGPECPLGEFLAGFLPHPICMTDEIFQELYGKKYGEE
jgi:hypothetical protein